MKTSQKDRYEKKLLRFIHELDKGWNKYRTLQSGFAAYLEFKEKLFKKYGFTDEEWNKACRLIRSWTADENGIKKTKRHDRKKMLRDGEHMRKMSDNADNPNGEAEIEEEDRWIADVFDTYDYDKEDMSR
jgi:hypothetical protein